MSHQGWGPAAPILRVRDLDASLAYYVDVLGFRLNWNAGGIASVTRDRCCVFLCEGDQTAATTWVWLGCDDVDATHQELRAKGAIVRHPPTNYFWAFEMQIADPDGNVLRIGSDPKEGEPEGEFLDANGRRWGKDSSGGRREVR
jgi:catechol 2,3-dioxygenase-like lactoylglutathione lyase family enzyme